MSQLFVSIPHSGEKIPPEADWLKSLEEKILMCDVDRYVDELYQSTLIELKIPHIIAQWHRYALDLNRKPSDIDENSIQEPSFKSHKSPNAPSISKSSSHAKSRLNLNFKSSSSSPHALSAQPISSLVAKNGSKKKNLRGLHWVLTTKEFKLIKNPISFKKHKLLLKKYYFPYHENLSQRLKEIKDKHSKVFLLDAHSMPSKGTRLHRDPGEKRAEIVISDWDGKSAKKSFSDLVVQAFKKAHFKVVKNWPYKGGYITQHYGKPHKNQNAIQIEINRALYMNEETKRKLPKNKIQDIQKKIKEALQWILKNIEDL